MMNTQNVAHRSGRSLICLILLTLVAIPVGAVDVVLSLDRSLSMKGNDPNRDSIKGADLLSELLGSDDRLGLATFAQDSEMLLPLTRLSGTMARERISSLLAQVRMDGIRTNFESALRTAYQIYPDQSPGSAVERILVLFSDGQLNLGSEEANQAARAAVLNDLIPTFQAAGIRIHGVAFSPEADLDFLNLLADATGGQAFRAKRPEDIYHAFVKLFEQADQPLTTPVINGEVKVDANVRELKLLVKRDAGDGPMRLTNPSGRNLSPSARLPGVDWKSTPGFDRVTIQQPEAGSWKVTANTREKKAYIQSDLDLKVTLPALARLDESETVPILVRLIHKGAAVDSALMKNTRFTVRVLNELGIIQQQLELHQSLTDQAARGLLRFTYPGAFQVRVSAKGLDFQRHKSAFIRVLETAHPVASSAPQGVAGDIPKSADKEETPDPNQASQRSAFFFLLSVNLTLIVLVGIGAGVWWWRRRGRKEPDDLDDED